MNKLNIAIFFGGASPEHEISKISAINIINKIDPSYYNILPVYITKDNKWLLFEGNLKHLDAKNLESMCQSVTIDIASGSLLRLSGEKFKTIKVDLAVPIIHGKQGEDGSIQGLFELASIKYVGCGILASAICMDKSFTKLMAKGVGLKTVPDFVYKKNEIDLDEAAKEARSLGYPVFIKPASSGSSVGTNIAKNKKEVLAAIEEAFAYGDKIIIEKFLKVREVECAIIDDDEELIVSDPGEITTTADFYDYTSKYLENTSKIIIPSKLTKKVKEEVMEGSKALFKAIDGKGLARVDFFVTEKNEVYFNEMNTMPGFTDVSMYPKLAEYMGISQKELLEKFFKSEILE
ncbi:MAG: D-alanine--D-alanine ligase [Defluviitaleaceae bacterium]|nr:D-alanine--D-alanine ligase [Defluviitaleaceae bacterium]